MKSERSGSKGEASGAKKPRSTTQKSAQNPNSDRTANVPVFSLESECASRGFSSQSLLGSGNLNFSVSGHGGRGGGRRGCDYRKEENDRRSHGSSSPSVWGSGSPNFSVGGHTGRGGYDDQTEENDKGSMNEVGWNNSRGGIGGNGAQRGESRRIDALSRLMSSVLRHRADKLNLNIRSDGYVAVKDLLNMNIKTRTGIPLHCYTVDDFKEVVKRDNKQRFGLLEENNVLLMRANQGHSMKLIDSEGLLKPIVSAEEVPVCVHGTYLKDLESIKKSGLSRMKRNHVHFARGLSTDNGVISGMRSDCQVMIYLADLEDGPPQPEPSKNARRQSRNRRRRQRNPSISEEEEDERPQRRSKQNQGGLPGINQVEDTTRALTNTAGGVVGNVGNTAGQVTGGESGEKKADGGSDKPLKLRLDVNLDIEITLEARVHGDLTLALLR